MHTQPTITIEIAIPPSLFDKCREQPSLLLDLLTEQQIAQIKLFVFDNLEDKDGAPDVENLDISVFRYSEEERNGSFRLHFYINRRFCCSDTESSRQDYMDFHFSYLNETLNASATYFNWNLM
ncbi:MAG TPA: hypothetical protein VKZ57_12995 [Sphingobacterium sp.]|jgi:hypothetical protein|nr:hypothetical protein [Sphingobacterium sp.]